MNIRIIFLFCLIGYVTCIDKYRICAYPNQQFRCGQLTRDNSNVICTNVFDSIDCAWKISENKADFGVLHPEQAFVVNEHIKNLAVVAELRHHEVKDKRHSFQTVVLVKKDYTGGINGLRGKLYCHPGLAAEPAMNLRVEQEFENVVVNPCGNNKARNITENEVKLLSQAFSKACRPGKWAANDELNKELKRKYPNLCELCDNPNTCEYDNNNNPGWNAMICLTEKNADVAYTTAQAVHEYFTEFPERKQDYKFLCRSGNTQEISNVIDDNCTWRNQPWNFILARNDIAVDIRGQLEKWIDSSLLISKVPLAGGRAIDEWKTVLKNILTSEDNSKRFYLTNPMNTLESYLHENKQQVVKTDSNCDMNWCTVSVDEDDKCEWLSKAMELEGIKLKMNCIQGTHVYDCLKRIKDNKADIMAIDSQYGFIARKYGHLRTLMYFEESSDTTAKVYTIVNVNSGINKFEDLKGKKACFPEYRGIAWLSFVQHAIATKQIKDDCDYGKSIGEYFTDVCAPGVKDEYHVRSKGADQVKLCSLCKNLEGGASCEADYGNKYYNNNGSISCILDDVADVAFVEVHQTTHSYNDEEIEDLRVLCKSNEMLYKLNEVPDNCYLTAVVNSEIVTKSNNDKNFEMKETLMKMDEAFISLEKIGQTMSMFASFKGKENLLFLNTSVGITDTDSKNQYVQNYQKIFEAVDKCTPNSSSQILSSLILIISVYILNVFM